jgi:phage terminase large subunit-like protein
MDFMDSAFFYPTQMAFFAAGSTGVHQRLIFSGNQMGKTLACSFEVACHLTGQYPNWWRGKRFKKPIRCWVVGESVILVRDTLQKQLCGGQEFGSGTVPLYSFAKKPIMVPGGTGSIDTAFVTHETDGKVDGVSSVTFKTFEQRREKLQSESVDLVWIDEKPDESVYSELLARTSATDGIIITSFTPIGEGGASGVTYKFLSESSPDRAAFRIRSEEVKHISQERREELAANYSDAERETRLEGTPQLGAGPVFQLELLPSVIKAVDFDSVPSYCKMICGVDFGYKAGFAAVLLAWAPDTGDHFVVDSFQMQQSDALHHTARIHAMCRYFKIPIAWPHDGHQHDKGSGIALSAQYKSFGLAMLAQHAQNHGTTNFSIEPTISEIRQLMSLGKIAIGSHNLELIEQMRMLHRDENFKIVKQRDHLVDALRYALMMKRKGKPLAECDAVPGYGGPMPFGAHRRSSEVQFADEPTDVFDWR